MASRATANTNAPRAEMTPVTSGRPCVLDMSLSMSRSRYMLKALAPPAARARAPGADDEPRGERGDEGGDDAVRELERGQQAVDVGRQCGAVHQRPVAIGEAGALAGDGRPEQQEHVGRSPGRHDES